MTKLYLNIESVHEDGVTFVTIGPNETGVSPRELSVNDPSPKINFHYTAAMLERAPRLILDALMPIMPIPEAMCSDLQGLAAGLRVICLFNLGLSCRDLLLCCCADSTSVQELSPEVDQLNVYKRHGALTKTGF